MDTNRRRYREGQEFHYDLMYESEARLSDTLNRPVEDYGLSILNRLLDEKHENLEGRQAALDDLLKAWQHQRQINFNSGSSTKEDNKTRERRLTAEAMVDITKWEVLRLEEAIKGLEADKEADVHPIMPQGPVGWKKVSGLTGTGHVDRQKVDLINGVPCIHDERSPYNGMAVTSYITHVVGPWLRACDKKNEEMRQKLSQEGTEEKKMKRRYTVPRPEWPAGVKNYLHKKLPAK